MEGPTGIVTTLMTRFTVFVPLAVRMVFLIALLALLVTTTGTSAMVVVVVLLRHRLCIDSSQGELGLVVREGLEGLQDCNVVRCVSSVREVEV